MSAPLHSLQVATRPSWLGRRPVWRPHASTSLEELRQVGLRLQIAIPQDLVQLLLELGFGDIHEELSFRKEWLTKVQTGPLVGHLIFAQDERGSFYTADPESGAIHFLSRSEFGYCRLASHFTHFLEQAAAHEFKVMAWAEAQPLVPYAGEA
jgi:hypothetical protein